jgi:hypothetical protein
MRAEQGCGMKLTPSQKLQFDAAMQAAFPSYEDLDLLTDRRLGVRLAEIAPRDKLAVVVLAIRRWAEKESREEALLYGALEENGSNTLLRAFAAEVLAVWSATPGIAPTATAREEAIKLERLVLRRLGIADASVWRNQMERSLRVICLVQTPKGSGTGSLIGPDLVLTNRHVVAEAFEGSPAVRRAFLDGVTVAFQHPVAGAARTGYRLVGGDAGVVASDGELDYAVLRIDGAAGNEGSPGGGPRGWLSPFGRDVRQDEPLFVLQHPEGNALGVAAGSIREVVARTGQVFYSTNTLGGSSGSPCFDMNWVPVAIHRGEVSTGNTGVLLSAIHADLTKKGVSLEWEATMASERGLVPEKGPPPAVVTTATASNRFVVSVDLFAYSDVARKLDQQLGAAGVSRLIAQIRGFIDGARERVRVPREEVEIAFTGDGAILAFHRADQVHRFAQALHESAQQHNDKVADVTARRCFRTGAAAGVIELVLRADGGIQDAAGIVIADAVRLQSAAGLGDLLVDGSAFAALSPSLQSEYGPMEQVRGKRDETFAVRRRTFAGNSCDRSPPAQPIKPPLKPSRRQILELLARLHPPEKLERLIFLLEMPSGVRPAPVLTHDERSIAVVLWAVSPSGPGEERLLEELSRVVGS